MAARGYQSKSRQRRFFMLLGGEISGIVLVGTLPDGQIGVAYSATLQILGAIGACTVDIVEGIEALPAGLTCTLHPDGDKVLVSGTPMNPIAIIGQLPSASPGVYYDATLKVVNAAGLFSFDLAAGALPSWMSAAIDGTDPTLIRFTGTPV